MEEIMKKEWGLREINSSELQIRGGAKKVTWTDIFDKIRNIIDFIGDYIPKLIKGFSDGFLGVKLFG